MNISRALWSGILGGIGVVAAIAAAGWLTGTHADLCALGGVVLTGRSDAAGWLAGAAAQLAVAIIAAMIYAAIFEWVTRRAGAAIGLAIAIPHAIVAGLAIGFIPVARLLDADIGPPGAFMEYRGPWVIATFVAAHLAFGLLLGALYGATRHRSEAVAYRWQDITSRS